MQICVRANGFQCYSLFYLTHSKAIVSDLWFVPNLWCIYINIMWELLNHFLSSVIHNLHVYIYLYQHQPFSNAVCSIYLLFTPKCQGFQFQLLAFIALQWFGIEWVVETPTCCTTWLMWCVIVVKHTEFHIACSIVIPFIFIFCQLLLFFYQIIILVNLYNHNFQFMLCTLHSSKQIVINSAVLHSFLDS